MKKVFRGRNCAGKCNGLEKSTANEHDPAIEQSALRVTFSALRPKPRVEHLGLRVTFSALRPKPRVEHLGLRVAYGALRPKPLCRRAAVALGRRRKRCLVG
jgi:hypothetical protein